jgi:UDP-N-acetylglucosamine/UDP-N-acetylgalactosamine diphosphorylase
LATTRLDDDFHVRGDFRALPAAIAAGVWLDPRLVVLTQFDNQPCKRANPMGPVAPNVPDKEALLARLRRAGQEHLLAFWDRLDETQRKNLAGQIAQIDWNLLAKLRGRRSASASDDKAHFAALAARAVSPPAIRLSGQGPFSRQQAIDRGQAALRAGEVGMILVAGGLGTRLGFDQPKGMFEIGPLSKRCLFAILIDQLLAVARRHAVSIPLYLMTSPATDAATREFFWAQGSFGLTASELRFFCQATMWALDDGGEKILLEAPDSLFLGPDGHGGMLQALVRSGCLADARARGIKYLFYGQVDNPLLSVCDPYLIGCHILSRSQMTTQAAQKRDPLERVGNVVSIDGRVHIIEYSDLPEQAARQTNPDGSLKLWAGNLAVHIFDVDFLEVAAADPDALPFHTAHKKVPCLDAAGNPVEPARPNAIRFERFIFDLLPRAENALVVEADPAEAFAPVKNADGEKTDTPQAAQAAMIALHRRWLKEAGMQIADTVAVEINPLWALDAAEIAEKLRPGTRIERNTYFSERGPVVVG